MCQISRRQHITKLGCEIKQFSSKVKALYTPREILNVKLKNQSDRGKQSFQYNYSKRKGIQIN